MARRILLADDSVTAQNMGRRILHDAGYDVTTVNNGSAALKRIAEQRPDLIILDVYMPGYGGLEVCSRLKENKDTARIPVLLTVGKLEPFKPEEARRVRADAYIVKPFEASELLTALTKLEDKIVPGPEPYKQGRFAKAAATAEHSADESDFGDQETGWKDRLIIPGGKKKKDKAAEPESEPVPAKGFRSVVRDEDFRPAERKKFDRPIPAGLPEDIRPEEIAAIAAAAAKINGKSEEVETPPPAPDAKAWPVAEAATPPATSAPAATESVPEDVPAVTFASAPEKPEASAEKPEPELQAAATEIAPEPAVEATPVPLATAPAEAAPEPVPPVEDAKKETEGETKQNQPASDAEVLAALASLTPTGSDFATPATTHAEAAVGASFTGPRWTAEAVAVAEEESTTLLEHEMEKAYAAFAAADAALAAPVEAVMPVNGNGYAAEAMPDIAAAEEPHKPLENAATPEPAPGSVDAVATETGSPVAEEAAFAAAASANAASPEAISENQPVASAASLGTGEPEEGSRMREAELAAAWANWRQIRESIIGEQPNSNGEDLAIPASETEPPAAQVPEASAPAEATQPPATPEVATEIQPEAKPQEEPSAEVKAEVTAAEEQDPTEISSIVDNMLAELKPKLMEELKRKLKK